MKKSIKIKVVVLLLTFQCYAKAQSNYFLFYEKNFSEKAGAENILILHKAFYSAEERILPANPFGEKNVGVKIANGGYRLIKSFLIDYPVDYFIAETQHEAFGHGARFREFKWRNTSYHMSLPPPYGDGHGFATGYPPFNSTDDEHTTMVFSGVESGQVLAESMREKWIMADSINYRDFFLYGGEFNNLTNYIYQTLYKVKNGKKITGGNDMNNYIYDINSKYYLQINAGEKKYSIDDLGKYSILNFIDPYQYMALYHWMSYIISGKEKGKLPMIKIGKVKYLPSFNMSLSPFGAEFYDHNYLKWKNRVANIYLRIGDPRFEKFYGFGIKTMNLLNTKYGFLHTSVDVWNQPSLKLQSGTSKTRTTAAGYGYCFTGTLGIKVLGKKNPVSIVVQPGYKTDGFVKGEILSKGFFMRFGIGIENL